MSKKKPKKQPKPTGVTYAFFDAIGCIVGTILGIPIGLFFLFLRLLFKAAILAVFLSLGGIVAFWIAFFMIICGAYAQEA